MTDETLDRRTQLVIARYVDSKKREAMNKTWLKKCWDMISFAKDESAVKIDGMVRFKSDEDDAAYIPILGEKWFVFDGTDILPEDEGRKKTYREWFENLLTMRIGKWFSHIGFYNAAKDFFYNMQQFGDKNKTMYFGGYSRGGPIACLVALHFALKGYKCKVVTFGSPKYGGTYLKEFMERVGLNVTRVEIVGDPVPHLPLSVFRPWLHYEREHIVLESSAEGGIAKHQGYAEALQ